jgi:hypothetical protein
MKKQLELDKSLDSSWKTIVSRPSYRKRALIACSLLSFIYSSGTLTISSMTRFHYCFGQFNLTNYRKQIMVQLYLLHLDIPHHRPCCSKEASSLPLLSRC